jgi:hypothetical protein
MHVPLLVHPAVRLAVGAILGHEHGGGHEAEEERPTRYG